MTASVRFPDVAEGTGLPGFEQPVTQEFIDGYAAASLDLNPVHIDPEWASRAQVFGGPDTVLHGMATMSLMTAVVTRAWGATVDIRRCRSKFTRPVWVGQTLSLSGRVRDLHYMAPGRNYVVVEVRATDADGELAGLCDIEVHLPG